MRYATIAVFAVHVAVSQSTVRRWIAQGLPVLRRGRVVRIVVSDAETWLRSLRAGDAVLH